MTTSAKTDNSPAVWIGCVNCYTNGRLIGDWFEAVIADGVTIVDVHSDWRDSHDMHCEEIWCYDHAYIPVKGEMSISEAAAWGQAYEELGNDELWDAYCEWVDSGCHVEDGNGIGCTAAFEERYQGAWESFSDFAYNEVESTGMLRGVPETVARYFDYEAFARDLEHDYTVADAAGCGVYIFRNF